MGELLPVSEQQVSTFERIMKNSACVCSFCVAMWEIMGKLTGGDVLMDEGSFAQYAAHLRDKHGWANCEIHA